MEPQLGLEENRGSDDAQLTAARRKRSPIAADSAGATRHVVHGLRTRHRGRSDAGDTVNCLCELHMRTAYADCTESANCAYLGRTPQPLNYLREPLMRTAYANCSCELLMRTAYASRLCELLMRTYLYPLNHGRVFEAAPS